MNIYGVLGRTASKDAHSHGVGGVPHPISFMVTAEIRVELRELLDRWRAHHI
jgi:hypothetical protein